MPSVTPLSQTPHYYSVSLPRSATNSYFGNASASRLLANERRARKISVSHADIALLSDQNAELLQKLEKLESESTHADQSGRRVLKRLEKEIQDLREELEKAQAKSEELEEKAKAGFGLGAEKAVEEVWRKKMAREAKFRAMRNKYGSDYANDEDEEPEVRDFAPGGALSVGPDFSFSPSAKRPAPELPTSPDISELATVDNEEEWESSSSPRIPTETPSVPKQEYALISQLLLKIRELEEANVHIMQNQVDTASKLQAMQRETENMSKVYECLGDQPGVEWELVMDGDVETSKPKKSPGDNTIRFKSLRRTLEGDLSKMMSNFPGDKDTFGNGVEGSNQDDPALLNIAGAHKTRKSVVGLFNTPTAEADIKIGDKPPMHKSSGLPVPFPSLAYEDERRVSWSMNNGGVASPALSSLSLTTPQSQCLPEMPPFTSRTLESELGSELSGDWGINADNHHLRTSSLYNLSHLSVPPSPSPMPANRLLFPSTEDEPAGLGTPVNSALQLSVEPPLPQQPHDEKEASSFWQGKQSARYRRMSQTVRSRTNRWVDGRFKDTLLGEVTAANPSVEETENIAQASSLIPKRLAGALDAVMETFTGRAASDKGSVTQSPRTPLADQTKAVELHVDHAVGGSGKKEKPVAITFVLELWLWFQFGIIILVFLWAMAKRGPKSVLGEVDKRRVLSPRP